MTLQTKQLTSAFDKQSRHISDLLAELREKESVLHNQQEELQRCKQELDASKAHKAEEDKRGEQRTLKESNTDSSSGPQEIPPRSPHTNNQESICDSEAPPSKNQGNQLLQKQLLDVNASKTNTSLIPVEDGKQESQYQAKQNLSSSPAPSILDPQGEPVDVTIGVTSCEKESVGEERCIEERMEEGCQTQINQLQQQVLIMFTLSLAK